MVASSVARDPEVCARFDRICFAGVGQDGHLQDLQKSLYFQLTNSALPGNLVEESEVFAALQAAAPLPAWQGAGERWGKSGNVQYTTLMSAGASAEPWRPGERRKHPVGDMARGASTQGGIWQTPRGEYGERCKRPPGTWRRG